MVFRRFARCAPDIGALESSWGPEMGIEGRLHACSKSGSMDAVVLGVVVSFLSFGAPPMIPPSMNLIAGDVVLIWEATERAVAGAMALRSR